MGNGDKIIVRWSTVFIFLHVCFAELQFSSLLRRAEASPEFGQHSELFPPMKEAWPEVRLKVTGVLLWADPRRSWRPLLLLSSDQRQLPTY